jgi:hypothetical protein
VLLLIVLIGVLRRWREDSVGSAAVKVAPVLPVSA